MTGFTYVEPGMGAKWVELLKDIAPDYHGVDVVDQYRRAAGYVDRILHGTTDLPVQLPTKFSLTINAKTAKALGLTVPDKLFVAADEVIE